VKVPQRGIRGDRFYIIITNPAGKLKVSASSPDCKVKGEKVSLLIIHASIYYDIVRLLFTSLPVSALYLDHLSGEIARRETILKARASSS
jgi:hypothetical protein